MHLKPFTSWRRRHSRAIFIRILGPKHWKRSLMLRGSTHGWPRRLCRISTLEALSYAPRFNAWMAETIMPYIGESVLEIGAGIGNLTRLLIKRRKRRSEE